MKIKNLYADNCFQIEWEHDGQHSKITVFCDEKSNKIMFDTFCNNRELVKQMFSEMVDSAVFYRDEEIDTKTIELSVEQADVLLDFTNPNLQPTRLIKSNTYREAYFILESSNEGETHVLEVAYSQPNTDDRLEDYQRWHKNQTVAVDMFHAKLHITQ
jgi:hypothetical protein